MYEKQASMVVGYKFKYLITILKEEKNNPQKTLQVVPIETHQSFVCIVFKVKLKSILWALG